MYPIQCPTWFRLFKCFTCSLPWPLAFIGESWASCTIGPFWMTSLNSFKQWSAWNIEMPYGLSAVTLYCTHRKPPLGVKRALSQSSLADGDRFSRTARSVKTVAIPCRWCRLDPKLPNTELMLEWKTINSTTKTATTEEASKGNEDVREPWGAISDGNEALR